MKTPTHYQNVKLHHPDYIEAVEQLGKTIRAQGPLKEREAQLVQLAAAVACSSEGAAHSHTRRALEAGASIEELRHCVMLLTSTIGFPKTMAGLTWVNDVVDAE